MESRPRRSRRFTALALMIAGALGCGGDPRIIATFRQGTAPVGYTAQQVGAYYYYNPPTVADGHVYIGTSSPAIAIKTGPVFFRDREYYERLGIGSSVWSVQLDVDVDLTRPRGSATEAAHPAPGAAAPETGAEQTVTPP